MPQKKMSDWHRDLVDILEQLEESQMHKLLLVYLTDIPLGKKEGKTREQVCQLILEQYGPERSVSVILQAMDGIPRMDAAVRDLLQPHVDRLNDKENHHGNKRPAESGSDSDSDTVHGPKAGRKRKRVFSESSDSSSEDEEEKTCKSIQEVKMERWRKTVQDVLTSASLANKVMVAKLVQKSGLRSYKTKQDQTKFFFHVSVADHTDCIKVMVYGKERYDNLQQGRTYNFREVLMDDGVMKVTKLSSVTDTGLKIQVPEQIEVKAETLVYPQSPVCSISDAKGASENCTVSIEGTIKQLGCVSDVKLKNRRRRVKSKQDLWLSDGSDSIRVCFWDQDIHQLRDKSVGDTVRVTNVRMSRYYDNISLNSTFYTRVVTVSGAALQNVSVVLIGVGGSCSRDTQLEVELHQEVAPFLVQSRVLAEALGIRLEGDFKERLLKKIPLSAKVEIKGNRINAIKVV